MAISFRNEAVYFFGALRFFTRLPVPAWAEHSAANLACSMRYFPAVGLIVGAAAAASLALASLIWPKPLAILSSMALTLYMTGVFHEDGLGDTADGFGSGGEKSTILDAMKDSRLGSFGALSLCLILIVKFYLLAILPAFLLSAALVAGHAFSRLCATLLMRSMKYARDHGNGRPLLTPLSLNALSFAAGTACLPLFFLPFRSTCAAVVLALVAASWLARLFQRRIGGYTGDCLGATQQFCEVSFYFGYACAFF